jgi:hypothetical protein
LPDPFRWDPGDGAGGEDPVERGVLGPASRAVTAGQERATVDLGEVFACRLDEPGIDVHRVDVALAEVVAQHGGVVAGAGPDLQHAVAKAGVESVEHDGHHGRFARRRSGQFLPAVAGRCPLGEQRGVGVHRL